MRLLNIFLVGILFTGSAHAQFGGFLKDLKSAAEGIVQNQRPETVPVPAPAQSQNTKQETFVPGPPSKENTPPVASSSSPTKATPKGPPEKSPLIAFQCKINGKELIYRNNLDSDDPNISVRMESVNAKPLLMDYDWRSEAKDPLYVSEETGNRALLTTVYFKVKQTTYSISLCEGMMCGNVNQPYSFAVFNGDKKISSDLCDEDTASEFNFPIKSDKNGKLLTQQKSVLMIKKSSLKFNPFD